MMKNPRIKQGLCLLACTLVAGTTLAQDATTLGGRTEVTTQTTISAPAPTVLRLGQIQVKDSLGQPLGAIEDIVVSPQGCIDMAVVSLGGTRLVPVPWQIVRTEQLTGGPVGLAATTQPAVIVDIDRTRLAQAPSVDRAQLRTQLAQAEFTQRINTYYGVRATGTGSLNPSTDTGIGTSATNMLGRTNLFPTGRTNLFRGSTNTLPPGRALGRPETIPPGPSSGAPGYPDNRPPFTDPGSAPITPGTPTIPSTPGTTPTTPGTPPPPGTSPSTPRSTTP